MWHLSTRFYSPIKLQKKTVMQCNDKMLANFDETFLHELDSSDLDSLFQSSIQTHFNMKNPDDWILAYSLIKTSTVKIPRMNNKELLYLTNNNPQTRGPKSSRFTCPICGSITVSMKRLQRHVNQHGQKLHLKIFKPEKKSSSLICEKCKATFSSSYALRKHQRVHTRDKPFSCDFCASTFSQWGNLRHHIQRHLGISPYACPYCQKTFIAPCKLEGHIRGHLDERPYVCDQCQSTFRCNDDLRKHLIIHTDYKPFVCWLCTKEFFHASKLRIHMKEKHNLDVMIKKKDVLESGTEYEITVINQDILSDNEQLLNELNIKSSPFGLVDHDLGIGHHQNHFDEFKLIDFSIV